jgi:hypothetical protein
MNGPWSSDNAETKRVDTTNASPQPGSTFLTLLPPEVRRDIYAHLWLSNGLEQHILLDEVYNDDPKLLGVHLPPDGSTTTISENPGSESGHEPDREPDHEPSQEESKHRSAGSQLSCQNDEGDGFAPGSAEAGEATSASSSRHPSNDMTTPRSSPLDAGFNDTENTEKSECGGDKQAEKIDPPPQHTESPGRVPQCESNPSPPPRVLVGNVRRKRCVTDYLHPDLSLPDGLCALDPKVTKHRRRHDPSFVDGTDPVWHNLCFWCKEAYDCYFDISNMPNPPRQRSDFMSMLLVCKSMHREVLSSIMEDVRWSFAQVWALPSYLEFRFPMNAMIRRIVVLWSIEGSYEWQMEEWKQTLPLLDDMPQLREIEIWMDYGRRWSNNQARAEFPEPRQARIWANVPGHVHVRVTYPQEFVTGYEEVTTPGIGQLHKFVEECGGWVNDPGETDVSME